MGRELQRGQVLQDGIDAYPLVGHPVDGVLPVTGLPNLSVTAQDTALLVGFGHTGVVEGYDLH